MVVSNAFGMITNTAYLSVLDLKMYAGLTVAGPIGTNYRIESLNTLGGTNTWRTLTSFTLTTSPTVWIDMESATQPRRFYRAVPNP